MTPSPIKGARDWREEISMPRPAGQKTLQTKIIIDLKTQVFLQFRPLLICIPRKFVKNILSCTQDICAAVPAAVVSPAPVVASPVPAAATPGAAAAPAAAPPAAAPPAPAAPAPAPPAAAPPVAPPTAPPVVCTKQ